jgi:hypothetical protein
LLSRQGITKLFATLLIFFFLRGNDILKSLALTERFV